MSFLANAKFNFVQFVYHNVENLFWNTTNMFNKQNTNIKIKHNMKWYTLKYYSKNKKYIILRGWLCIMQIEK